MKRPLVASAIALICGILLADVNIYHSWGIISLIIITAAFLFLYRRLKDKLSVFILLVIPFIVSGYIIHSINKSHYENILKSWEGLDVSVEGRIYDQPEFDEGKTRFVLEVKRIGNEETNKFRKVRMQITVYSDSITALEYGSFIRVNGEIKLPQGRRNLGGFNARKYMAGRKIAGTMSVSYSSVNQIEGRKVWWLKEKGYEIRNSIIQTLRKCLPKKEAALLTGMLIGHTADMPEEMEEDFRRAGLSHIMAVSGANIAFLLAPLLWVFKKIGFNPRWSSALAFPLMIFYVFATGMEASVVRAAIMAGITLLGMIFWRRTDIFCSMAASVILILFWNSFMLFDMGFILSFMATLSLVVFYKPIFSFLPIKIPKSVRDTFAGTVSAQLGVVPIIAYCFNTFSFISIFSNLLIIPLTGVATLLGAIVTIAGSLYLPMGLILGFPTRYITYAILLVTEGASNIPWAEARIATPSILLIIIYYIFLIYIRYGHPKLPKEFKRPLLAAIVLVYGIIFVFLSLPDKALKIYFADVGQGDSVIISTPEGRSIIIDGGGSINDKKGSYTGDRIVVPLLYNLNMLEIDIMIATHGHADHIGGLKSVIEKAKVRELIIADAPDIEMRELMDLAYNKGIIVTKIKEGDIILNEDGLVLKALYPLQEEGLMPLGATVNANELSLVTRLDYGDFSAIFTGDIGARTEKLIVEDGAYLECDLLKVAHHGSKYSSSEMFIDKVNPRVAIISVGINKYGHPDKEIIKRLEQSNTRVYQTINNGGIMVKVNRNSEEMKITTVVQ